MSQIMCKLVMSQINVTDGLVFNKLWDLLDITPRYKIWEVRLVFGATRSNRV